MKTEVKSIVIGRAFVDHVDQNLKPTLEVQAFLKRAYVRFFTNNDDLINHGYHKSMGYIYNFEPYLKKYLYEMHGSWRSGYAPNKTLLRKVLYGTITKIIEL